MQSFVDYGLQSAALDMFSMLVGVLSTQIYLQVIFSAKNLREAKFSAKNPTGETAESQDNGVFFFALLLVFTGLDSALLKWSYMSMGLRGSAIFAGLFVLVFMKKYCHSRIILILLYMLPAAYIIMNVIW